MNVSLETLVREITEFQKPGLDPRLEAQHVLFLLSDPAIKKVTDQYEYHNFIASGGSGLVFAVTDLTSHTGRALKLSRAGAIPSIKNPNDPVDVKLEIDALSLVNHQNVTRFYQGALTNDGHYALVTQLVEKPLTIDQWVCKMIGLGKSSLAIDKSPTAASNDPFPSRWNDEVIRAQFLDLAKNLHGYALALSYMHETWELFHMDVKPGNLLVGVDGTPYVTDLGFARCKRNYSAGQEVPVGFTFGFHHPDLGNKYRLLVPESVNKAWSAVPIADLNARFDLYAFGRTILFLLKLFQNRFGERMDGQYPHAYLHLLAALLLDARNVPGEAAAFATEIALGIDGNLLNTFKFMSFGAVVNRLERFLGMRPIEFRIPELNRWYPKSLNHGAGNLTITPRINSIIEHPAFRRLRNAPQLSTVAEVYAGATHTRHAHCLGVAGVICECLCSLYNDPENPIFNVLVDDCDITAMIVASLLHDLGQSEFGHELEEIDNTVYHHTGITKLILESNEYRDRHGRTLRQIIQGDKFGEWSLRLKPILAIIGTESETPRFLAFRNLLDSPIDADKIDYLTRDSVSCNVPYGRGLDIFRFLRCITVLPIKSDNDDGFLSLGIKEKGLASSGAITLARFHMYQAVYLHHTARDLKAVVMTACAAAHFQLEDAITAVLGGLFKTEMQSLISKMFMAHLIAQTPDLVLKTPSFDNVKIRKQLEGLWQRLVQGHRKCEEEGLEFDRSISFFYGFAPEPSKRLFRDYFDRIIYKRLFEVTFAALSPDELAKVKERLGWRTRDAVLVKLRDELKARARKQLEGKEAQFLSLNTNPQQAIEFLERDQEDTIVADLPLRELGPGGKPPPVLKDISRKRGQYRIPPDSFEGLGHVWKSGMVSMMKEVSICRIYCHPKFFDILNATLRQTTMNKVCAHILWDQPIPPEEE